MRISDWSSDVCSSDLHVTDDHAGRLQLPDDRHRGEIGQEGHRDVAMGATPQIPSQAERVGEGQQRRSEEHTSELQSLMRISYAVFCLKKKKNNKNKKDDRK